MQWLQKIVEPALPSCYCLSMHSTKSTHNQARQPQEPTRKNGILRVEAILKSASDVISEKGYQAATMLEIAVRANTRIGSLYRFFPNKESLSIAMMRRFQEKIEALFDRIDEKSLTLTDLADSLLFSLIELKKEGSVVARLLEEQKDGSGNRGEFREALLKRIARSLKLHAPGLGAHQSYNMAFVVLQNMKAMKDFSGLADKRDRNGVIRELRRMNRLYLKNRLKDP